MLLNQMKETTVVRRLKNGVYTGTLVNYVPSETSVTLTFLVEGTEYSNQYDDTAVDKDQKVWHPSMVVISNLRNYLDSDDTLSIFEVFESIKSKATPLRLAVNGMFVKLLPHDAPLTTEKQIIQPSAPPARKARA